jgi:perosamine synthetase
MTIEITHARLSAAEIEAATRVLAAGALRQGNECLAFEREFAEHVGARHAVTCANGTAALHLAYLALLKPGDEVLVPAMTFIATASMVTAVGAVPVLCDVDSDSFLIDINDAERRVTPRTRAIAPVHLHGNACPVSDVQSFARRHGLKIVWDAAQAHGARFRTADIGSLGDLVCYSFYPSKNLFVGEGGMVCGNDPDIDHAIRYMRTHGQTSKNCHTMFGFNYRMTDVEAAIGRQQLRRLDDMLAVRRRNAAILTHGLGEVEGITPQRVTPESVHAWHQYSVVVDPDVVGCDRDELARRLADRGIQTGVHYPRAVNQQPAFRLRYGDQSMPVAERLAATMLSLPVHHGVTEEDASYIVKVLQASARRLSHA